MASLQCPVPSDILLPKPTGIDVLQLLSQMLQWDKSKAASKTCSILVYQVRTASVCGVEPSLLPSLA